MHLLAPFLTALTLLLTFTTAKQSRPFFLVLQSSNTTLNGRTLFAGHEGAAIEGLFLGPKLAKTKPEYATFHFNTTKGDTSGEGLLTWVLEGSNFNGELHASSSHASFHFPMPVPSPYPISGYLSIRMSLDPS